MSKDIPYFRFTISEWLNDEISYFDYSTKGVFIDICCFYWFKDCEVSMQMLSKRFANAMQEISKLLEEGIIKQEKDSDFVFIKFLDDQFEATQEISSIRSKSAKKRWLKHRANVLQKQCKSNAKPIYKDKDKDKEKDNIERRALNFKNECERFENQYGKELISAFYSYWSEPNKSKTKIRCELEKTWDISRRLSAWASREKNFNKKGTNGIKSFAEKSTNVLMEQWDEADRNLREIEKNELAQKGNDNPTIDIPTIPRNCWSRD